MYIKKDFTEYVFKTFNVQVADKNKIEEKEFKCTIGDCSRNFSKIGYLKKHMSTDHENV